MSASQAATSQSQAQAQTQTQAQTRAFVFAWFFTVVFYFLEYAVRSSPSVMISGLEDHFSTSALGISHDSGSVLLHLLLDESGRRGGFGSSGSQALRARRNDDSGFRLPAVQRADVVLAGDIGRLCQGAGSAFAFTGAVYLAARGFPRALPRHRYRRHAMRRNARRLGWTVCRWADD